MNKKEKFLYHQIHPLKLFVDWFFAFLSLFLLWYGELFWAILVMFVPSIFASFLIIRFVDLEKYKESAFGKYVSRYMTRTAEAVRF